MIPQMSPQEYARLYLSLKVQLPTPPGTVTVSVSDYQNPGPWFVVKWDAATTLGKVTEDGKHGKHKDNVIGVFKKHVKTYDPKVLQAIQAVHKGFGKRENQYHDEALRAAGIG